MPPSNSWLRLQPLSAASDDEAETALTVVTTLPLDNRGLAYGDGFFTTMGVIDGRILWSDYHQQRLDSHASALHLDIDSRALLATLYRQAKHLQQGMLKLIVTRAVQDVRGYGYTPSMSGSACEIWLKSSAMPLATAEQMSLPGGCLVPVQPVASAICLSSQIACLPPPLAGLKSLNRLDNVLASGELHAIKAKAKAKAKALADNIKPNIGEGLLRDMSGQWVEGTMSNVFYQLSESPFAKSSNPSHPQNNGNYLSTGQWYTPSMAQSGVAGVMRQALIDGLSSTEQPAIIRPLQDEDLPQLSQLFFCNALRGIMPMSSLTLLSGEVVGL